MEDKTLSKHPFPNQDEFKQLQEFFTQKKKNELNRDSPIDSSMVEEEQEFRNDLQFVLKNRKLMEINHMVTGIRNDYSGTLSKPNRSLWKNVFRFPFIGFMIGLSFIFFLLFQFYINDSNQTFPDQNVVQNIPDNQAFNFDEIPLAICLLVSASETDPQEEKISFHYQNGNYQEAIVLLKSQKMDASSSFPDPEVVNLADFYIGVCELKLGELEKAKKIFETLPSMEEYDLEKEVKFYLGIIHFINGQYESAVEYLNKARESGKEMVGGKKLRDISNLYLKKIEDRLN